MNKQRALAFAAVAVLFFAGCNSDPAKPKTQAPSLPANDTPVHAVSRFVGAYENKNEDAYAGMFAGNFTYEFSTSTDPTLVQQYATGWFKNDETQSSTHLFSDYTPQGGAPLPAATTIDINLAVDTPTDDSTSGLDPVTHKLLATRVDGGVTVPQSGSEPLTYVITNNYSVFYLVRGDSAVGLNASQPADSSHWYIYRWTDLSEASPAGNRSELGTQSFTWGRLKGLYR